MPGMRSGVTNHAVLAAFRAALMHQGQLTLLILAAAAVFWVSLRELRPALLRRGGASAIPVPPAGRPAEPGARRVLRVGFGVLWAFDGLLQAQPAMATGLPGRVMAPAAATSAAWVRDLVGWAAAGWSRHPVQAAAAAVWVQVGIGVWMLAAERGLASRLAGAASAGWALVVWVFGEAFGGVFAPGLSVLFGAPGAVMFYCVAGLLVALPERSWSAPRLGRRLTAALGIFFLAMAVLQAWPGRGFWQGVNHGRLGSLAAMAHAMSATPQPGLLAQALAGYAWFAQTHGFLLNALASATLAAIGVCLAGGWRRLLLPAVALAAGACLADWLLVQDLGFLGGLGTDPNSMIPLLLLVAAGYAGAAMPAAAAARDTGPGGTAVGAADPTEPAASTFGGTWRERIRPTRLAGLIAAARAPGVLASWGAFLVVFGAVPMAWATVAGRP